MYYIYTLLPIYHSSRTSNWFPLEHSLKDSMPFMNEWIRNEVTTLSQLTTENTLHTGCGILDTQFAIQKSGRGNKGAIVFEMRFHAKILTTIRLVDRLACVASDGISYIDIEISRFLRIMSVVCGREQNGTTNLWPAARRVRQTRVNNAAFVQCFVFFSQYQSKLKHLRCYISKDTHTYMFF